MLPALTASRVADRKAAVAFRNETSPTTRWWDKRRATLHHQVADRHTLRVEREWKTPSLSPKALRRGERLVKSYARQLADESRLTYNRPGRHAPSRETEMFHGVDFQRIRAYADVIGRCDALW